MSCYLICEQTVQSMSTGCVRSLSDKADHTLTMHEHLCKYCLVCHSNSVFISNVYVCVWVRCFKFTWEINVDSERAVFVQMGMQTWITRSSAPRSISKTNWRRRNLAGKTLLSSTALRSYQARQVSHRQSFLWSLCLHMSQFFAFVIHRREIDENRSSDDSSGGGREGDEEIDVF